MAGKRQKSKKINTLFGESGEEDFVEDDDDVEEVEDEDTKEDGEDSSAEKNSSSSSEDEDEDEADEKQDDKKKKKKKKKKSRDDKNKAPIIETKFTKACDTLSKLGQTLLTESKNFKELIYEEYSRFAILKENVQREQEIVNRRGKIDEQVCEVDVGGRVFTTFRSTLTKVRGSVLEQIFSKLENYDGMRNQNGIPFLDRNPRNFERILNALRTESRLRIPEDEASAKSLKKDVIYLGLSDHLYGKDEEESGGGGSMKGNTLLKADEIKQLFKWIGGKKKPWKLIYKGSKDGFAASTFRTKCSMKGPTIVVIKSTGGNIFGGYTPLDWKSSGGNYDYDNKSFLFLFKNSAGRCKTQLTNTGTYGNYSIYQDATYGPCYGGGFDLYICDNCNTQNSSYSNLGYSFTGPGVTYGQTSANNFLAGNYNFTVTEIEVFAH